MLISWNTNTNAPGCIGEIVSADGSESILVMTDWDWPGVASTFGWSLRDLRLDGYPPCEHAGTDGTIDCPECGMPTHEFIVAAGAWLSDHDGATADDPGYF